MKQALRSISVHSLEVYQSLWGMEQRHPTKQEPSDEQNFQKIKGGGFAGATIDLAAHEIKEFQKKSIILLRIIWDAWSMLFLILKKIFCRS